MNKRLIRAIAVILSVLIILTVGLSSCRIRPQSPSEETTSPGTVAPDETTAPSKPTDPPATEPSSGPPPTTAPTTHPMDANDNGLLDCMEYQDYTTDTDGDGLSDYQELVFTATAPADPDTDGDGVTDAEEDPDGDGLTSLYELETGTDPLVSDTDCDGLDDQAEPTVHGTDPLVPDTDQDGASDGWEVANGTSPTTFGQEFQVDVHCQQDGMEAMVQLTADGTTASSVQISPIQQHFLIDDTVPGCLGPAFEFQATGQFGVAQLSFIFDPSLAADPQCVPTIYCLNEQTQTWHAYETVIEGNVATARTTHFSTYILLDRTVYERYLEDAQSVEIPSGEQTDSNQDGIPDYLTKLMCDGVIRSGTGSLLFGDYTYEQIQANADIDGDGIPNGQELQVDWILQIPEDATQFGDHYYKVFDIGYVWDDAQAYCESIGGYLATATTPEEDALIFQLIQNGSRNVYWLGASLVDDQWQWLNGEPWDYTHWGKNKPDGYDGHREDRLQMYQTEYNSNPAGSWNDAAYNGAGYHSTFYDLALTGFVCEWGGYQSGGTVYTFVNSSPIHADTDRDGFTDDEDPTPDRADVFASMTDYKKYYYDDDITVTLCASQPTWNSRQCYTFDDNKGFDPYYASGGTGHSYLGIDYADETKDYFGFYGDGDAASSGTFSIALLREDIPGYVQGELYDEVLQTYHNDYSGHPIFSISKTFVVDQDQVDKILAYREAHKDDTYDIEDNNCTTFAVKALEAGGIDPKVRQHMWTHDDVSIRYHVGDRYVEYVQPGTSVLDTVANFYYGYSPADTAMDIRAYHDGYVALRSYVLTDGREVLGYEVMHN